MDLLNVTATGTVVETPCFLHTVVLTAGSDAATAVLRAGGASGTIKVKLAAVAGTTASVELCGASIETDLHATLTGTSPSLSVAVR